MPESKIAQLTPEPRPEPDEVPEDMPLPSDPNTVFLGGLFLLALLAAFYVASPIILPLVLAFVLKLLIEPAMRFLEKLRIPRIVGALLAIILLFGGLAGLVTALSGPAAAWITKLPEGLPRLEEYLSILKAPIDTIQRVMPGVVATGKGSEGPALVGAGLATFLLNGTRSLADGLFTTFLVLFFLLISGDTFLRRLVEILPKFSDKRQAVDISQHIERDISAYLLTITVMNTLVGIAVGVALHLYGLDDALLWGAVAFLLNFVPILGPFVGIGVFALVGLLTFDSFWQAMLVPGIYFGIHLIEGETITPLLLARRFTLNPVLVILSLVFWYWMWGVPGAILAVPMLAILKIVCDRIRPLMAFGHFLEG